MRFVSPPSVALSPLELSQLGQQLSGSQLPHAVRQEIHNSMEEAKNGGRCLECARKVPLLLVL